MILFHEQAPSCVLKFALRERVSGASSLVCTEICFAGACFRSKLPRVYWLGYLPGSVFREHVSGASSFVCTGWSTYPGACLGSVFQEQAPSCVPAFKCGVDHTWQPILAGFFNLQAFPRLLISKV